MWLAYTGVKIEALQVEVLNWIVTVIWIVAITNSINFLDNMDGLSAGVAAVCTTAFLVTALSIQQWFVAATLAMLLGAVLGFLWWNFPPAKIFMGDTGSLFIGLVLAACSIAKPSKSPTALIIGGPMLALALPVLDTLIVMQQRFGELPGQLLPERRSGRFTQRLTRMFNADRRHIHHILVLRFGSPGKAIFSIWIVTLMFACSAVLTATEKLRYVGYSLGIAGFILMLLLRYGRRGPHDADGSAAQQVGA